MSHVQPATAVNYVTLDKRHVRRKDQANQIKANAFGRKGAHTRFSGERKGFLRSSSQAKPLTQLQTAHANEQ